MAGYGIDSIGSSYAYDPYFMYAYNSPSFMANQTPAASPAAQTNTQTEQSNYVTTPYNTESSSNAGLIAGGLLIAGGAATLIYASKRGNGKGIKEGFKNIWKGITGKADDILNKTSKPKEKLIKITMGADGKPVYQLPNKTQTITNADEITNAVEKFQLKRLSGLGKNVQPKIESATFDFQGNTITLNNGKITAMQNKDRKSILEQFTENGHLKNMENGTVEDKKFVNELKEFIEKLQQCDKVILQKHKDYNLSDITYWTQYGPYKAKVHRNQITKAQDTQIQELIIPKQLDKDSDEVLSFVRTQREAGHNIDTIIGKDLLEKRKLPADCDYSMSFTLPNGNTPIKVIDGKPVGITIDKHYYDVKTDKFKAYLEKHGKEINEMITEQLKNGKIPDGAEIYIF